MSEPHANDDLMQDGGQGTALPLPGDEMIDVLVPQKLTTACGDVWVYDWLLQSDEKGDFVLDAKVATNADVGNEIIRNPGFPKGQMLRCRFDGSEVTVVLEFWVSQQFLFEEPPTSISGANTMVLRLVCSEIVGPELKFDLFEFVVPHVNFGPGDWVSGFRAPDGRNRAVDDHVIFTVAGVDWTLRKMFTHNQRLVPARVAFECQAAENSEPLRSIFSGHVALQVATNQTEQESAESTAEQLCWLLCLAMGQRVAWSQLWTRTGKLERFLKRKPAALPTAPSAMRPLTNQNGELKHFLEVAHPIYVKRNDWWAETLKWYAVACDSGTVETSAMIFSMLLDRVGSFVLEEHVVPRQIGSDLSSNLETSVQRKNLTDSLHEVMKTYSSGWDEARSARLVATILEWNKAPSYPKKIAMACRLIGLNAPPEYLVKPRNTLLHGGALTGINVDILKYYNDAHRFITALLFKLLGYEGDFFCPGHGKCQMQDFAATVNAAQAN
jgi:hypothetical protein